MKRLHLQSEIHFFFFYYFSQFSLDHNYFWLGGLWLKFSYILTIVCLMEFHFVRWKSSVGRSFHVEIISQNDGLLFIIYRFSCVCDYLILFLMFTVYTVKTFFFNEKSMYWFPVLPLSSVVYEMLTALQFHPNNCMFLSAKSVLKLNP